jgi:D-arabinose 1-dehydrogenase-like Zn-dependent alcohol dehydrogenase
MKVRLLHTTGQGSFEETVWDKPDIKDDEIEVKAVMTGVCRSDIDMMMGDFGPLPLNMQGHEGLGQITKVGSNIFDVKVGELVATRGEPAFADFYNVRSNEYVKILEANPKYILEPVACGINLITQAEDQIVSRQGHNSTLLIIGSGFLAWVAYCTLKNYGYSYSITVLGSSNSEIWGNKLSTLTNKRNDVVIDLSGKYELGTEIYLNNDALIVDGVGKAVSKKEAQEQLWRACTTIKPSPRNPKFIQCMNTAKDWIENGDLTVDHFWTKRYNRDTEWQQAFTDGLNRPKDYSRGYIIWN